MAVTKQNILDSLNAFYETIVYTDFNKLSINDIQLGTLLLLNQQQLSATNLFTAPDPGVEQPWSSSFAYIERVTAPVHSGNYALKLLGGSERLLPLPVFTVEPKQIYRFGFWAINPNPDLGTYTNHFFIGMYEDTSAFYAELAITHSTEYKQHSMVFSPEKTTINIYIDVYGRDTNLLPIYLDDFFLYKL
jgi:hypothetical protein